MKKDKFSKMEKDVNFQACNEIMRPIDNKSFAIDINIHTAIKIDKNINKYKLKLQKLLTNKQMSFWDISRLTAGVIIPPGKNNVKQH